MIGWRDPSALVALLLPLFFAAMTAWAQRRRARDLARFVESRLIDTVLDTRGVRQRRALRFVLVSIALVSAVIALAGPTWGFRWQEVRTQGIDLVIAIDTSRSMLATDVRPDRLARAKLAIQDLLAELRGDRVALVPFAGTAFVQSPLTLDRSAFRESLEAVEVGIIPRGGTNLAAAIESALEAFEGREGQHQAVVLITDGETLEGSTEAAVARAQERGVRVFTVGIGTPEGELIPADEGGYWKDRQGRVVKSRLDEQGLQKIAVETGGVYLHAEGYDLGLAGLYRDHVATMEKRAIESTMQRRYEHRYQLPLALALALLACEAMIGERGTRRRLAWRRKAGGES